MKYGTGPIKDEEDLDEVVQKLEAPRPVVAAAPKAAPWLEA